MAKVSLLDPQNVTSMRRNEKKSENNKKKSLRELTTKFEKWSERKKEPSIDSFHQRNIELFFGRTVS